MDEVETVGVGYMDMRQYTACPRIMGKLKKTLLETDWVKGDGGGAGRGGQVDSRVRAAAGCGRIGQGL